MLNGFFRAALIDISMGILISHLLIKIWDIPPDIQLYVFGIFFSVIMDVIEGITQKIIKGEIFNDHRHWAHYPLITIPLTIIPLILLTDSFIYATLAGLCLLSHYIHDSLDIDENEDDGIAWWAPFRLTKYQISVFVKETPNERIISIKEVRGIRIANQKITVWLEKYHLQSIEKLKPGLIIFISVLLIVFVW